MSKQLHETQNQERRRFVRADIYAVTRYFCSVRDKEIDVQTRISDISEGGVKLITFEEGIPIDTIITLNFRLPDTKERLIAVKGAVKYTGYLEKDLFRSGVEFCKLGKKDLQAIRGYVAQKHR